MIWWSLSLVGRISLTEFHINWLILGRKGSLQSFLNIPCILRPTDYILFIHHFPINWLTEKFPLFSRVQTNLSWWLWWILIIWISLVVESSKRENKTDVLSSSLCIKKLMNISELHMMGCTSFWWRWHISGSSIHLYFHIIILHPLPKDQQLNLLVKCNSKLMLLQDYVEILCSWTLKTCPSRKYFSLGDLTHIEESSKHNLQADL